MTAFVITRRQLCFLPGLFSFLLGWNLAITKTFARLLERSSAGTKVIIDPGPWRAIGRRRLQGLGGEECGLDRHPGLGGRPGEGGKGLLHPQRRPVFSRSDGSPMEPKATGISSAGEPRSKPRRRHLHQHPHWWGRPLSGLRPKPSICQMMTKDERLGHLDSKRVAQPTRP